MASRDSVRGRRTARLGSPWRRRSVAVLRSAYNTRPSIYVGEHEVHLFIGQWLLWRSPFLRLFSALLQLRGTQPCYLSDDAWIEEP